MAHHISDGFWKVKHPNGHQYTMKNLDRLSSAFGFSKDGLENLGWSFEYVSTQEPKQEKAAPKRKPRRKKNV